MARFLSLTLFGVMMLMVLVACGGAQDDDVVSGVDAPTVTVVPTEPPVPTDTAVPPTEPAPLATATIMDEYEQPETATLLKTEVVAVYDHDTAAFTQGLLWHEGGFYESTGLRGESSLRRVSLEGDVETLIPVESAYFAEGLVLVDGRLIQLTWQSQVALIYDLETLEEIGHFEYSGEGWGICYSAETDTLWMSDGSDRLTERDPETLEALRVIQASVNG